MIRPILRYGEDVLHRSAADVEEITPQVIALIDDMIDTMYAASGVGLAAPQVGVPLRLFVADASSGQEAGALIVMINPTFMERDGLQKEDEGCLSVPGFNASVPRPSRAVVRGLDRDGASRDVEATGILARAFDHEMDHLDGSLFLDRLRGIRRDMMLRKIHKLRRTGKW
jgi:peptide deformylase